MGGRGVPSFPGLGATPYASFRRWRTRLSAGGEAEALTEGSAPEAIERGADLLLLPSQGGDVLDPTLSSGLDLGLREGQEPSQQ